MLWGVLLSAQQPPVLIHSHNDYWRPVPFWTAYSHKLYSYEADVYYVDGKVYVAHDREDILPENTLERLYVEPVVSVYKQNDGKPWKDAETGIQLLVDIKDEAETTLPVLVDIFGKYPEVFDPSVNPYAVRIAITGSRPAPEDFADYPTFIGFDGFLDVNYTPEQLERVYLISEPLYQFVRWNGKGTMLPDQEAKLKVAIDKAHSLGKPIRFWATPECESTYYTFYNLGIDFVNTDHPATCAAFFSDYSNKNFQIGEPAERTGGVTRFANLDKTTRDFSGFQNEKLQLSKGIDVYEPTYASDGKKGKIRNVIYLIGDGMGLNQITAGYYANKGLTIFNMNHIGFQVNNALGAFTTDSAAGGSALATGERHANRHISSTIDGQPIPSLSNFFDEKNYAVGVLTLGNVADATPSAFYGHSTERDNADEITRYLLNGHVDLLCGSGMREFTNRKDGIDMVKELKKQYSFITDVEDIDAQKGKVICIDERMDEAVEESSINLLADAVKESLNHLEKQSKKGFLLMVEGAKIDYAGHAKSLPGSVLETLSFDLAVAEALKFADSNGETLVIVTADHETGGLVLLDGDEDSGRVMGVYVTNDHTPSMLPVFAYGLGSDRFIGTYMNTEIARRIKSLIK